MKEKIKVKKLVILSLLMAMTTVLKFVSIGNGEFRISLFEIPIILAGIISGPLMGIIVAFGGDLIYGIIGGYSYSFIMSLSAMMWGLMGGLLYKKKVKIIPLVLLILITSILTTINNSFQQYIWYKEGMWARLPLRIVVMLIKIVLLPILVYILHSRIFETKNSKDNNKKTKKIRLKRRKRNIV